MFSKVKDFKILNKLATKTLNKFVDNSEANEKNNALSMCDENANLIEKIEEDKYQVYANEQSEVKMIKVNNIESYYEFDNNPNLCSDKARNGDLTKGNNNYTMKLFNRQVNQKNEVNRIENSNRISTETRFDNSKRIALNKYFNFNKF